jgi:hypothetical protein
MDGDGLGILLRLGAKLTDIKESSNFWLSFQPFPSLQKTKRTDKGWCLCAVLLGLGSRPRGTIDRLSRCLTVLTKDNDCFFSYMKFERLRIRLIRYQTKSFMPILSQLI